jgi:hypothetical protein
VERVRRWCRQRVPEHLRDQLRVECDAGPGHLTIVECRPPWRKDMAPVARQEMSDGQVTEARCRLVG